MVIWAVIIAAERASCRTVAAGAAVLAASVIAGCGMTLTRRQIGRCHKRHVLTGL